MKPGYIILTILFSIFSLGTFAQASSSSAFELTVHFDYEIAVEFVDVHYYEKGGNAFEWIHFERNLNDNSITLSGVNNYILWVAFPTIIFSQTDYDTREGADMDIKITEQFFLVTNGPLSSFANLQTQKIEFTKDWPNVMLNQGNRAIEYEVLREQWHVWESSWLWQQAVFLSNHKMQILEK
jgi:hypothetical protein